MIVRKIVDKIVVNILFFFFSGDTRAIPHDCNVESHKESSNPKEMDDTIAITKGASFVKVFVDRVHPKIHFTFS